MMTERIDWTSEEFKDNVLQQVHEFSVLGLRTLIIAKKSCKLEQALKWKERISLLKKDNASNSEELIGEVQDEVE